MGWYHLLETSRELGSRRCRMGGLRGQLAPGLRWKQLPVPGGRITRSGRRGEAVGGFLRRVLFHEARLTSKNRASWPLCNPATGCNWRRRISGGAVRARAGQRAHKTARSPQCDLRRDLPASPEHGLQPTCRSRSHELLLAGHVRRQRRARCSAVQRGQCLVRCWSWSWRWSWRLPALLPGRGRYQRTRRRQGCTHVGVPITPQRLLLSNLEPSWRSTPLSGQPSAPVRVIALVQLLGGPITIKPELPLPCAWLRCGPCRCSPGSQSPPSVIRPPNKLPPCICPF